MWYLLIILILITILKIKQENMAIITLISYIDYLILNNQLKNIYQEILIYKIILLMVLLLLSLIILKKIKDEHLLLIYMAMIGLYILIESTNLITIFLALELQAFIGYILIFNRTLLSAEGSLKYFLIGAIASGLFILGASFLYGQTNSIDFLTIFEFQENFTYLIIGLLFMLIGLAFKIGAAPFHLWMPDAYTAATYEILLFIGIFPKIFLLILIKTLFNLMSVTINQQFILIILLLSLLIGSLYAVKQQKIKRFISYTIIYNNGFFLALTLITTYYSNYIQGLTLIFYLMSSFLILLLMSNQQNLTRTPILNLRDLLFLQNSNSYLLLPITIGFFALIGIPPMSNFLFKIFLFNELIDNGYLNLTFFLIILSILPSFYYLRVITLLYFKPTTKMAFLLPINKENSLIITNFIIIIIISIVYITELLRNFS